MLILRINYFFLRNVGPGVGFENITTSTGGIQYSISPSIGIRAEVGYRSLNAGSHDATFFMPGDPPASVDYSGITGEIKAVFSF